MEKNLIRAKVKKYTGLKIIVITTRKLFHDTGIAYSYFILYFFYF